MPKASEPSPTHARRLLLDVNVWVALFDDAHIHNPQALTLVQRPGIQIASCPLVENGVLRVMNLPGYSGRGPAGFEAVRGKLKLVCVELDHQFWPDDLSLRDDTVVNWGRVLGHNQITDAYLLALAVAHQGCLASFDHRIAVSVVQGATPNHLVLL